MSVVAELKFKKDKILLAKYVVTFISSSDFFAKSQFFRGKKLSFALKKIGVRASCVLLFF